MANREDNTSPEIRCVFVETSLDTRLALPVHKDEIISDFKDKLRKEHKQAFPEIGEINVSALKVKRRGKFYHFSESMNVYKAFDGVSKNWFMYVDAVRDVEKCEVLTIMAADDNRSNLELVEKEKELVDGMQSKALILYEDFETQVVERESRKRKIRSSDGKTSRKRSKVQVNQSELCGKVQVEVASRSCVVSPRDKLDDVLMGTDIESGERNGVSMEENQQTSDVDMLLEEKIPTVNSVLVDGHTRGEVEDVPDNQTVKKALDHLTGAIQQDTEKGGNTADIVMTDQEKDLPPPSERERLANPLVEAVQKETKMGEKSVEDVERDNIETDDLATHPKNHLEANSELTTSPVPEKKKKRKKRSKDHINQHAAIASTTTATEITASREIVNEINGLHENVVRVDATSESYPISRSDKENEMGEKIDEDVGSRKAMPSSVDNFQTDNLVSHPEIQVTSGLTSGPSTEKKKKKQKKSSKDHINNTTAATIVSKKIVNEREKVSGSKDHVDTTSESISISRGEKPADTLVHAIQNETEMGDKFVNKVGSREATPIDADKIQDANILEVASLTSIPSALVHESKDHIPELTDETTSREHEVLKEKGELDADKAKSVKSTKRKSAKKVKTPAKEETLVDSGAQNVEPVKVVDGEGAENVIRDVLDSLQQSNEVVENLEKSEKKSRKRSKKKDSLNIVEEVQVVESLQQKNEDAEKLEKSGKKSSKKSKKKDTLNIVEEAQILSVEVNNAAQVEASPINNPKDTDASFTPAKKNTESNASHLNKIVEVNDTTESINRSIQTPKENANSGDNFGSSQKDNIVGGGNKQGAKSKKDKKEVVKKYSTPATVNKSAKKTSNSVSANKRKTNFFKDAEMSGDESNSNDSTKTPSNNSSDNDSDVTSSMFRKQGNNLVGGTNTLSGSLQDILRSSKSYKVAKLTASQSQPEEFEEFVPDSQAN